MVITHVHVDHVGWNETRDGELVFPRARILLSPAAIECARFRAERPHIPRCVLGPIEQGVVDALGDGAEIVPGVTAFALPGHDPGHIGLRIGEAAVLIADAAVHPALLDQPEQAARTRRGFVAELADSQVLVVSGHYPGSGIGRVVTRNGRVVWEEAAD